MSSPAGAASTNKRLSDEQWHRAKLKALKFRQRVVQQGEAKGFSEIFRLAALKIEEDIDSFCDRAEAVFDEIDAFGHEPQLDEDWLAELTGVNDNFYFSTEKLVQEPELLPKNRERRRKQKKPDEAEVVQAVEEAVQSFEQALAVSHSEDVNEWIQRITSALEDCEEKKQDGQESGVEFWVLQLSTGLSPSALFLGLLLGHQYWKIEQKAFYTPLSISLRSNQ